MSDNLRILQTDDLDALFWPPSRYGVPSAWYTHVPFAHWLVSCIQPRLLVELGTHNGVSYSAFCEAVARRRLLTACFAVDTWLGDEHAGYYGEDVYSDLNLFNNTHYAAFSQLLRCTFDEALPYFDDCSIDLLHIDALHTYQAGKHDFDTWLSKLSDRAVVLFHDTNVREREFGIWRLFGDLKQQYPTFEFLHGHGLGVVAVGTAVPPVVAELCSLEDGLVSAVRERFASLGGFWASDGPRAESNGSAQHISTLEADLQEERARIDSAMAEINSLKAELLRLNTVEVILEEERSRSNALMGEIESLKAGFLRLDTVEARLEQERARANLFIPEIESLKVELPKLNTSVTKLKEEYVRAETFAASIESVRDELRSLTSGPGPGFGRFFSWIAGWKDYNYAYQIWKLHKKKYISKDDALRNIGDKYGVRLFFILYPLFKITRLLGKDKGIIPGRIQIRRNGNLPTIDFDAEWYLKRYPDVAACGADPLEHYLKYGLSEGRLGCPSPGNFDGDWYLRCNPEVAATGMDLLEHYLVFGKAEGRLGCPPRIDIEMGPTFDSSKRTVFLISHDGSQTGAPILAFNLLEKLAERYNVVSVLLGSGSLENAFRKVSSAIVGPFSEHMRYTVSMHEPILDACRAFTPDFAIVNSIESREALIPLAEAKVPSVLLVHEFASLCPELDMRKVATHAGQIVFPARRVWEDAVEVFPWLAAHPANIVIQGQSRIPREWLDGETADDEEKRIAAVMRPDGEDDDAVVVIGCGYFDVRKGIDLFLSVAASLQQRSPSRRYRFVWVGKVSDDLYISYLTTQVKCSGLQETVRFLGEVNSLEPVYALADIFLLSSRLDPFPNVAIDAMLAGIPLVCFNRASGVAEMLSNRDDLNHLVVPYADVASAADEIERLSVDASRLQQTGSAIRNLAVASFDMDRYVDDLENLAQKAALVIGQKEEDFATIARSGLVMETYAVPPDLCLPIDQFIRLYVDESAGCGGFRCPFPGFHPGIYRNAHPELNEPPFINPLAHFIRGGEPAGPWLLDIINPKLSRSVPKPPKTTVALHLHIHYPDLTPEILRLLPTNRTRPDLFITVSSKDGFEVVTQAAAGISANIKEIMIVPNRGRDVGPLMTLLGERMIRDYEIIGHLHAKRSTCLPEPSGDNWRRFCLENLLGKQYPMMDIILGEFGRDPHLGLVFPCDPNICGWTLNRPMANALLKRMGMTVDLPDEFFFPVGTMFWARTDAIAPFLQLDYSWNDYPPEPLPYDGTILHAIERLLPFVARQRGFRVAGTFVPGVSR